MSLRLRLVLALSLVVVGAVAGGTALHLMEVSHKLNATLERQTLRVASSIRTELVQTGEVLDEELNAALRPGFLDRWLGAEGQGRVLGARARLSTGRLEILKVLTPRGTILTSGHWPASFGALDPGVNQYLRTVGPTAQLVDEATPAGTAPSLQRWTRARWGARDVIVVAGRFLDATSLERMRATVGADLLALCQPVLADTSPAPRSGSGPARCTTVGAPETLGALDPDASRWRERFVLTDIPLGDGPQEAFLALGLDRADIDEIEAGIVRRALVVGAGSILIAILLAFVLAVRLTRPIEALADAAGEMAEGDLSVRVAQKGGGPEVDGLIGSFNLMASEIERSQERLKQAERVAAWREIARGLAHELKNPLTPIRGAMDVIKRARALDRPDFDEILDEQAGAVLEEVSRLKELSDGFAHFARLPDPRPEALELGALIDKAVALYAVEDALVVERHFAPALATVVADRTQLQTCVTNLVKNAVEAMDHAGVLTLTTRPGPDDDEHPTWELVVDDSGPGIADEIKDRLFTPYVTTKGSRGTGLGLALVHRIVMEHGGAIEVGQSRRGGARFVLRFPIRREVGDDPRAETTDDSDVLAPVRDDVG